MKKNKKRLIALLASGAIIVFSWIAGTSSKEIEEESASKAIESLNINSLLGNNQGGKKVIQAGDTSTVIQKITINGTIDESMTNEETSYSVINQIKTAKEDPNVKAIMLSVNTPGGGVYESSEIYNALVNSGKDVYVVMKKQATSGGYYISMASKKIFANEETTTGSLGVVMSNLSMQKFLEDNGIKNQVIRSGEQKAVGGLTEDIPESTLAIYKELNKESYDKFVDLIVKGRNMSREKVLQLADGRVYSGKQALNNGLIDQIGTEKDLIEAIKEEKGLSNPEIVEYVAPKETASFLNNLVSSLAQSVASEVETRINNTNTIERNYLG